MIQILPALAGLALTLTQQAPVPAHHQAQKSVASKTQKSPPSKTRKSTPPKAPKSTPPQTEGSKPVAEELIPSEETVRVSDWVAASGDNRRLPYAIVDKKNAAVFLFDGKGKPLADGPVLIGIAPGDEATPGVGSKNLAEIGPAEKTTPAGRYLAKFGLAVGKQRVLWVDYANSVALHPIPPTASKKEHRRERMLSPTSDDNRITFGCINVPKAIYARVQPLFQRKGGYVYVLPDSRPIEEVFPLLRVQAARKATPPSDREQAAAQ